MTTVVNIFEVSTAAFSGYVLRGFINKTQTNLKNRQATKIRASYNATKKRIALLEHETGTGFSNETIEWILKQKVIVSRFGFESECVLCKRDALDYYPPKSKKDDLPIGLKKRLCAIHLKSVRATW